MIKQRKRTKARNTNLPFSPSLICQCNFHTQPQGAVGFTNVGWNYWIWRWRILFHLHALYTQTAEGRQDCVQKTVQKKKPFSSQQIASPVVAKSNICKCTLKPSLVVLTPLRKICIFYSISLLDFGLEYIMWSRQVSRSKTSVRWFDFSTARIFSLVTTAFRNYTQWRLKK